MPSPDHPHHLRLGGRGLVPFVIVLGAGCSTPSLAEEPRCSEARKRPDGTCCEPLTSTRDEVCAPRRFSVPQGVGPQGDESRSLALAVDGSGHAVLAWERDGRVQIAEERDGTIALSTGPELQGRAHLLELAAGPHGEAVLLWRQAGFTGELESDGAVYLSQRAPGGTFVHPAAPVSEGTNAYEPRAAIGESGDVFMVFNQWTGEHYAVAWSTPTDLSVPASFATSQEEALSPPIFYSNAPVPAVAPDGSLLVSWYQSPGGPLRAYVSERRGRDGAPRPATVDDFLSDPGAPVDSHPIANPKPALFRDGQAAVAWTQEDGEGHVSTYLATRDAAGTWYRPKDLHDALDARRGRARCAQLTFDSEGDLFVVWERDHTIELDVRMADGAWLAPHGAPLTISRVGEMAIDPTVAAGRDGGVLIAYRSSTPGGNFRIVTRRWSPGGLALDPEETISLDADGDAQAPLLAIGGPEDRAVVAWLSGGVAGEHQSVRFVSLDP